MVMGLVSGLSLANHSDSESFLVVQALFSQDGCQREGFWEVVGHVVSPFDLSWTLLVQFSSVQSLSHVWLFVTPWTGACQASLSITNSQSLPKLMSFESVMLSNYLILCHPLLLLPSIFLSIRVFSNESALSIRWPKYWNFSFNISPSNELFGLAY